MRTKIFELDSYDYPLNESLIAKYPAKERGASRLLVFKRNESKIEHTIFKNIVHYLKRGDVLVINDSKVIKARLIGKLENKEVEVLFTKAIDGRTFEGIGKPMKKLKEGKVVKVGEYEIRVVKELPQRRVFLLENHDSIMDVMEKYGKLPLPHYIDREPTKEDEIFYQTVYAQKEGSIASPTAGLHFTNEILKGVERRGVKIVKITLHVGLGTFQPIRVNDIRKHKLEPEYYEIPEETGIELVKAKREGRRIIAVGTTSTRTLEYWNFGENPNKGWTDLFIHPPYKFKVISALITNFHLPKSTPFILVCAFIGSIERTKEIYMQAMDMNYRFYSYGDAMFII